jgi:hypothetical protein
MMSRFFARRVKRIFTSALGQIDAALITDTPVTTGHIDYMGITIAFLTFHHLCHPVAGPGSIRLHLASQPLPSVSMV